MSITRLKEVVDKFAVKMKQRLFAKFKEGYTGWDDKMLAEGIAKRMVSNSRHAEKYRDEQSLIDTANLAMMLWWQEYGDKK